MHFAALNINFQQLLSYDVQFYCEIGLARYFTIWVYYMMSQDFTKIM